MNPFALFILLTSLAFGTIVTLTSSHWILAWIGLEINTLAIIPLMAKKPHPRAIEASTKYFLTQAAASALILFATTINAWLTGEWTIFNLTSLPSSTLLSIALAIKLGIAPLHFWLPDVLQGVSLTTGLILSTWQKLAPMALLFQLSESTNLTLMLSLGILSSMVGGWGGINQTQTRKILAFSSIAHLGWMVAVLKLSPHLTIMNFILYIIMTSALFLTFMALNTKNIYSLSTSWSKSPTLSTLSLLSLLSLSGLPPLTGFLPKWLIAQELVKQNLTMFSAIILISTLLSLFFYLRLAYSMVLTLAPNTSFSNMNWPTTKTNATSIPIVLSLLILPITPAIISAI